MEGSTALSTLVNTQKTLIFKRLQFFHKINIVIQQKKWNFCHYYLFIYFPTIYLIYTFLRMASSINLNTLLEGKSVKTNCFFSHLHLLNIYNINQAKMIILYFTTFIQTCCFLGFHLIMSLRIFQSMPWYQCPYVHVNFILTMKNIPNPEKELYL